MKTRLKCVCVCEDKTDFWWLAACVVCVCVCTQFRAKRDSNRNNCEFIFLRVKYRRTIEAIAMMASTNRFIVCLRPQWLGVILCA